MREHEHGVASAPRKQECRLIVGCARCTVIKRLDEVHRRAIAVRLRSVSSGTWALSVHEKKRIENK